MDEEARKSKIKFYMKDDTYYLYEAFTNDNGSYVYASNNTENKKSDIQIGKVGELLTEYLNTNISYMLPIIDDVFSIEIKKIDDVFMKLFEDLQNNFNYIFAVLILNDFFYINNILGVPGFSEKIMTSFNERINGISSYIDKKDIISQFDFQYLNDIDLDKTDNVPNNVTIFKSIINLIGDELELNKIIFRCLINNNLKILDLVPYNSITNIGYEILPSFERDSKNQLLEVYSIDDLTTFLYFEMLQIQKNNFTIRNCETCNKFFIPNDNRQIYCSKYCNTKNYENNVEKNSIRKLYRSTYKSQNKKKNDYKNWNNVSKNWITYSYELKSQMIRCENNEITEEDFKSWINRNKEWFLKKDYKPE